MGWGERASLHRTHEARWRESPLRLRRWHHGNPIRDRHEATRPTAGEQHQFISSKQPAAIHGNASDREAAQGAPSACSDSLSTNQAKFDRFEPIANQDPAFEVEILKAQVKDGKQNQRHLRPLGKRSNGTACPPSCLDSRHCETGRLPCHDGWPECRTSLPPAGWSSSV